MNDTLPTEVIEALRTLARIFTEAADAGTVEAFSTIDKNKDAHSSLDCIMGFNWVKRTPVVKND